MDNDSQWESFVNSLLDNDDECDSDSFRRVGERPPTKSLAWPTPTLFHAELITVRAYDHRSHSVRTLQNVLVKQTNAPQKAYLIRKRICKTKYGSVRLGLVLRRRDEDEADEAKVPWISTEELVALKVSSWSKIRQIKGIPQQQQQQQQQHLEDPLREVAAMQLVGNSYPHIVGCYEVLQDTKHLYAVMPYFGQGNNLHNRLFSSVHQQVAAQTPGGMMMPPTLPPNEDEARTIFRQLLKGLLQLQQKGIFHADLSLDNLLISKTNQLKIVDLGMSLRVPYNDPCNEGCITDVSEGRARRLIKKQGKPGGKLMYLAPEIIAGQEGFDGYAVDLWAAGVILFVLCVGLAPFKFAETSDRRYAKISSGGLKSLMITLKIDISPEACDLIQQMMWENPRKRLSLMEVMRHPWVMGETFDVGPSDEDLPIIAGDASLGSVSSTEPTQESHGESLKAPPLPEPRPAELPKQDDITPINPETRESAAEESSRDSFVETVHQVNHSLARNLQQIGPKLRANAQQVGPRIINNAQRIGPKLKHAVANVHIPMPKVGVPVLTIPNEESLECNHSPSTPSSSPPRSSRQTPTSQQIFRRLKTVLPNKTMSPPKTTATATPTA